MNFQNRCAVAALAIFVLAAHATRSAAQLEYQAEKSMDKFSAILPLSLENDVYRIRAMPPEGVSPAKISCDIGITGTTLSEERDDQDKRSKRDKSPSRPAEKVVGGILGRDNIDVQFADHTVINKRDRASNQNADRQGCDCGINIKYQNKKKVAQLEIRVGYVLPSGDVEGVSLTKLNSKQRKLEKSIAACEKCKNDIRDLESARSELESTTAENNVQVKLIQTRIRGLNTKINRMQAIIDDEGRRRSDLAAFNNISEYLKSKVAESQVFVHFHYNGQTIAVDVDELKRKRVKPIKLFDYDKATVLQNENEKTSSYRLSRPMGLRDALASASFSALDARHPRWNVERAF